MEFTSQICVFPSQNLESRINTDFGDGTSLKQAVPDSG